MGRMIDVTGHVFGRLTVIGYSHKEGYGKHAWLCECQCGNRVTKITDYLRAGKSRSCGCWEVENLKRGTRTTHGCAKRGKMTRTYRAWASMMRRCLTPSSSAWDKYGARGITVHPDWRTFEGFVAAMGECPAGLTLERLNVNGDYEPGNCVWATLSRQARNKRNTKWVTYLGRTQCLADWADELKLNYGVVASRLRRGWSTESAFLTPYS